MEHLPKLSIIVPAYNVERFLDKCLSSICEQTYRDFEVLLLNDGSSDATPQICEAWAAKESRIRYFSAPNRGVGAIRNFALKEALASMVMFVDSDDYIEPDMVEVLMRRKEETGAEISLGGYIDEMDDGSRTWLDPQLPSCVISGKRAFKEVLKDLRLRSFNCMKIFDKSLFADYPYPEDRVLEDFDIMPMIYLHAKRMVVTDKIFYHYVQHTDSILNSLEQKLQVDTQYCLGLEKRYQRVREVAILSPREKEFYRIYFLRQVARKVREFQLLVLKASSPEEREKWETGVVNQLAILERWYGVQWRRDGEDLLQGMMRVLRRLKWQKIWARFTCF